ncbi:MAG: epimerase [Deltaproteobacteria bacterium HGW-Deltaproteobacteria-2]|jgi:nucleoside-diphosphate-sugar epimerase|nr:MAG: epimerase [Deltaproteobacteria bacterium HGW-Deltaproteobacteria-2]
MIGYKERVGVIGATSIVGDYLLSLLVEEGWDVVAFSHRESQIKAVEDNSVVWRLLASFKSTEVGYFDQRKEQINLWISLAPISVLSEYFSMLLTYGAKHIVAVSSTSRFTKSESSDQDEKILAQTLAENEERLKSWAKKEKLTFTILRPTLVYGLGRDKNVSAIASFILRFSFYPVLGAAYGLRQPVHAKDVAACCVTALSSKAAINSSYNVSGGETISYREMVCRIFVALNKKPRFVTFPLWLFRVAVMFLRMFPPFRHWSAAMAERMNQDLVFSHEEASRDLGFKPRPFRLTKEDLPRLYSNTL